jgi:hypothetical protein
MRPLIASRESRKSPLVPAAFFVFAALAAWKLAGFIASGDTDSLIYALLIFLGSAITLTILRDWRRGLYLFLAWLVFEDFARKYLGNNMVIYFAKDVLIAILYIGFFIELRKKRATSFRPPFFIPLVILVWFGVIQIFNPGSPHFLYGLLGAKFYFYYVPLIFLGYGLITSHKDLGRFLFLNAGLAALVATLGIAQSVLGPAFLNPQDLGEEIRSAATLYRTSPETGQLSYRPTSLFVSTGRYADFLLLAMITTVGSLGYFLLRRQRGYNSMLLVIALIFGAVLLSASRSALLWGTGSVVVCVLASLWGTRWRNGKLRPVLRALVRAAAGVVLGFVMLLQIFPEALSSRLSFYNETLSPGRANSELATRAWHYPLRNFLGAFDFPRWPYGYGIGTTGAGTQYIARILHVRPLGVGVESGYGTIVLEMGIVGLLLWLVMTSAALISAWRVVVQLRGSPFFPIAFGVFWYALLLLFPMTFAGMQPYEDFIMNAYLWLLLGVLFKLPVLAKSTQLSSTLLPELAASGTGVPVADGH